MDFGVVVFPTDTSMSLVELGAAVEERGFESLFIPEHTHIPVSRRTLWPRGGELPSYHYHALDSMVALSALAATTTRLKLGTGICLVAQHDPIILAKQVASIDHMSGGRFLFGVGGGWNREEMENHGTDPRLRWEILRERVLAMKAIWTESEPEFHGRHVNFEPIWTWPKPVQQPHPPILLGGDAAGTFARVLEYGDGWMPSSGDDPVVLAGRIKELHHACREAGRPDLPVTAFWLAADVALVQRLQEADVSRCVFRVASSPSAETLRQLDALVEIAHAVGARQHR